MSLFFERTTGAAESGAAIGTPTLWAVTIGAVSLLFVLDFLITRKPHEVSMREAIGWSACYVALPLSFGVWVWQAHGSQRGLEGSVIASKQRPR